MTIVGPSGCGKTTLLRMIAGLSEPSAGSICVDGRILANIENGVPSVPPEDRDFGMVFQSYAIWPHMNVMDNVCYPLKVKKCPRRREKPGLWKCWTSCISGDGKTDGA